MKYIKLFGVLILLLLMNCAILQFQSFIDEPYADNSIKLPILISNLSISDQRRVTDDREINISWFALPGDKDEVLPKLSADQKRLINDEFMKYVQNRNDNYNVKATIEIVEGIENYKCSWLGEDMNAKATVCITLYDSLHTPYLITATGDAFCTFKSKIATKRCMEGLYQKAIKMAIYKAMESINKSNTIFPITKLQSTPNNI